MPRVRTVAAHEVVRSAFPRPVTERDEIGMAAGKGIDSALTEFSHQFREGRRPTLSAVDRRAAEILDEELEAAMVQITPEDRAKQLAEISGVLRAFRTSELIGLPRPRSRLILIDEAFGIYAQPDYWNGRDRFYEMKSYHAEPVPPDVMLQLRLFQLAFPGFSSVLAEFDRHSAPVEVRLRTIPGIEVEESTRVLRIAREVARATGQEKTLEYVENPVVRYTLTA
jgi:hypothetical protein